MTKLFCGFICTTSLSFEIVVIAETSEKESSDDDDDDDIYCNELDEIFDF